jgi:hypothetical protein
MMTLGETFLLFILVFVALIFVCLCVIIYILDEKVKVEEKK